jgi:hypothetical protein
MLSDVEAPANGENIPLENQTPKSCKCSIDIFTKFFPPFFESCALICTCSDRGAPWRINFILKATHRLSDSGQTGHLIFDMFVYLSLKRIYLCEFWIYFKRYAPYYSQAKGPLQNKCAFLGIRNACFCDLGVNLRRKIIVKS